MEYKRREDWGDEQLGHATDSTLHSLNVSALKNVPFSNACSSEFCMC